MLLSPWPNDVTLGVTLYRINRYIYFRSCSAVPVIPSIYYFSNQVKGQFLITLYLANQVTGCNPVWFPVLYMEIW